MSAKNREEPAVDLLVNKERVKNILAKVAKGELKEEIALERVIKIMDDYADKAIISFLEVGSKSLE